MTFMDDIKSGNCAIYGQLSAILAAILLIILSFNNLLSTMIIFSIIGWVISALIVFLEIPFLTACCRTPAIEKFTSFFSNNAFRAGLYTVFAVLMWLSITIAAGTLIVGALFLSFAAVLYAVAAIRKQDPAKIGLTGGAGVIQSTGRV